MCFDQLSTNGKVGTSLRLAGAPPNRLCRAAGAAPCKGVGATRSAQAGGVPSYLPPETSMNDIVV